MFKTRSTLTAAKGAWTPRADIAKPPAALR